MFLDNQPTDGGEVVSLTHRPPLTPRTVSGSHFCQSLSRSQGHSAVLRTRSFKSSNISNEEEDQSVSHQILAEHRTT
jgi:hypothetical protein